MTALGYLIGRSRSKEAQLLTAADWQKFQTADGLADWLSRLQNTPYAQAATAGTYEEFEKYLDKELADLRQDLFGEDTALAEIFWRKYDWHNLKILLKQKITGQNLEKYILPLGKNALQDFDRQTAEKAEAVYAQTADFCRMDYFLDQEYLAWLKKEANRLGGVVVDYAKALIDAANFRLWYAGAQKEYSYFPGGGVSCFAQGAPEEILRQSFPGIDLPDESDEGAVEKALDDYAVKLLFRGRYAFGLDAVFCLWQARENEIKNLKTMYLRQSRDLPGMQAYLRYVYD